MWSCYFHYDYDDVEVLEESKISECSDPDQSRADAETHAASSPPINLEVPAVYELLVYGASNDETVAMGRVKNAYLDAKLLSFSENVR